MWTVLKSHSLFCLVAELTLFREEIESQPGTTIHCYPERGLMGGRGEKRIICESTNDISCPPRFGWIGSEEGLEWLIGICIILSGLSSGAHRLGMDLHSMLRPACCWCLGHFILFFTYLLPVIPWVSVLHRVIGCSFVIRFEPCGNFFLKKPVPRFILSSWDSQLGSCYWSLSRQKLLEFFWNSVFGLLNFIGPPVHYEIFWLYLVLIYRLDLKCSSANLSVPRVQIRLSLPRKSLKTKISVGMKFGNQSNNLFDKKRLWTI